MKCTARFGIRSCFADVHSSSLENEGLIFLLWLLALHLRFTQRFSPVISSQGAAFRTICGNPLLLLCQRSWSWLTGLSPSSASVLLPIMRGTSNHHFPHPEVLNSIFLNSVSYLCLGQSQGSSLVLSWVGQTVKQDSRREDERTSTQLVQFEKTLWISPADLWCGRGSITRDTWEP